MKTISSTHARKHIAKLITAVRETGDVFAIGRRNEIEVLLIKFPSEYNKSLNDITNINTYSQSFDFLDGEAELYSVADLKKRYV